MSAVIVIGCMAGVTVFLLVIFGIIYYLYIRDKSLQRKRKRNVQHYDDEEIGTPAKRRRNTSLDFAVQPKGIPNVGETCYMNSMLQCLAWSPCLRAQLEDQNMEQSTESSQKYPDRKNRVAKSLLDVLKAYHNDSDHEAYDEICCFGRLNQMEEKSFRDKIQILLRAISQTNGRFGDGVQEDTFEFYNTLISTLQDEALEKIPRSTEGDTYDEHIMRHCGTSRLFGGTFLMIYCYEACGHVDTVFQPFSSLSIPVTQQDPDGLSKPAVTLTVNDSDRNRVYYKSSEKSGGIYGSLSDRTELLHENLDVDSPNRIEVKSTTISEPPEKKLLSRFSLAKESIDVIQTGVERGLEKLTETETMMASDVACRICKGNKGSVHKKLQVISLPPVLVLQINRFKQRDRDVYKVNEQVSFPKILDMASFCSVSMKVSGGSGKLTPGKSYSLFGVVNHHGSIRGGHYFAYIKTSHRNVKSIQNQLQKHTWSDPEKMASSIREQLEKLWHEELHIHKESDSQVKYQNRTHSLEDQQCPVDREYHHQQNGKHDSDTWFHVSDSSVMTVNEDTVMQSTQAYILMYEQN